jgi:hypothetical protein
MASKARPRISMLTEDCLPMLGTVWTRSRCLLFVFWRRGEGPVHARGDRRWLNPLGILTSQLDI